MTLVKIISRQEKVNPKNAQSGQKQPDIFDEFLKAKAYLFEYLKEKISLEYYNQLPIKYFAKEFFISQLWSKVSKIQTTISLKLLSMNRLKQTPASDRYRLPRLRKLLSNTHIVTGKVNSTLLNLLSKLPKKTGTQELAIMIGSKVGRRQGDV